MPKPADRRGRSSLTRLLFFVAVTGLTACSRAPFTNRLQLNLVPDPLMNQLGAVTYVDMLGGTRLERKSADAKTLRRVGRRISKVAKKPSYRWRFALIKDDDTINAWCLPGGKIAFYSGILPVLENEAGMAFVMGHEVGHAMARHGAERISQQATMLGGLTALYLYLDNKSDMPDEARNMLMAALGVGVELGIMLPFSRAHEKEADVMGMMYMANAGYPPSESIDVWTRMGASRKGFEVPAFLSTHPTHKQRKKNLREWMPAAKKKYARNQLQRDTLSKLWASSS